MREELKQFNIDIDDIKENDNLFDNINKAIEKMHLYTLTDRFEIVLNSNLIECKEKLTNCRTIMGCRISYDSLDRNISFIVREDTKPSYEELEKRINNCIKYLQAREDHDFNSDIPISILNGNINHIKEYLDRQIKIYEQQKYEYTEEMNCLKNILDKVEEI